ncbi:MAG TPA: isoprenylcysteine carboxylmethyltransferase family protein [Anaerolineales bacterium]|nr:isoprenylcysteine carboxylmethyltransferase family protein [Anaerolineales bacterium]HLF01192.1 isoprenylcysteine carboxylmethyltransferase family protein [Anaerolineales bacterium]
MSAIPSPSNDLVSKVFIRLLGAVVFLAAIFFLPAGTLVYWEAWVFMGILFTPMLVLVAYLLKTAPDLVERRMRMKETEMEQKLIMRLFFIVFALAFLLPGFDHRFGWSSVPVPVVLAADAIVLLGYILVGLVMRENRYASRVIEVEQEQKVITTGPYALIRHPMYLAVLLIYVFSPLALGSYWSMIFTAPLPFLLIARIRNEESVLLRELKGYGEYLEKTRYRLIPGVW